MANYKGYTQSQYDNQSKYLNSLINSGSAGQKAWAQNELASLNSQYTPSTPSVSTTPSTGNSTQTQAQVNASVNNSTGKTGTSGGNKYGTSYKYSGGKEYTSTDGGKTYADSSGNTIGSNSTAQSSAGLTSGWNNVGTGASGKTFETYGATGSILVNYSDGSYRIVNPTDSDYLTTREAMMQDLAGNGINYTPNKTWSVTQDIYKMDGSGDIDYTQDVAYTRKDYLTGNNDLKYALEQYMKGNGTNEYDIDGYVQSLYDRIGSANAAGTGTVTLDDVNAELNRLGLSDYNSQNGIYATGSLIPNNPFVNYREGAVYGSGDGLDFSNGLYVDYNGQSHLLGGDVANYLNYVKGKTGNTSNLDYIFGDMASNPYAMQDPEFLMQYNQQLQNFYNNGGAPNTGYEKVDQLINLINSTNNYNGAVSNMGGASLGNSSIWNDIQALLQGGLDSQKQFLASQKTQAELDAENLMRHAYVNKQLQGDSVREALSAAGLGTSGALQSAQLGVQNNYNNSLSNINNSLQQMIASLNEAKLQALIDHTNNMTNYAYRIQNDEQDRAYQNAQLYMQQLENQQAQQQQKWENWYKQQLLDMDEQQYADETEYARKQDVAAHYAQLVNAGVITMAEYQQKMRELGLI